MEDDDNLYLTDCERENALYLSEVIKDDFDFIHNILSNSVRYCFDTFSTRNRL